MGSPEIKDIDTKKIEEGVSLILDGMGEDLNREGIRDTPRRVAQFYSELFTRGSVDISTILRPIPAQTTGIITVDNIDFFAICEHHLLPFFGRLKITYKPRDKVVGLSKLIRVVDVFCARLQVQERLTGQIADTLYQYLGAEYVEVEVEANHLCMGLRGVKRRENIVRTFVRRC